MFAGLKTFPPNPTFTFICPVVSAGAEGTAAAAAALDVPDDPEDVGSGAG